jgi:hypothetical protein
MKECSLIVVHRFQSCKNVFTTKVELVSLFWNLSFHAHILKHALFNKNKGRNFNLYYLSCRVLVFKNINKR